MHDEGVDGVAPFGTTGEGQSFSVAERRAGLDALVEAGIAPGRILPATGCAALPDTVELTRHAVALGCAGALVQPPFFFKEVTDDGVFASYAAAESTLFRIAAPAAAVVDTTGAGDTFTGALAAALDHGLPWRRALAAGVAAGSLACAVAGAQNALPAAAAIAQLAATVELSHSLQPIG